MPPPPNPVHGCVVAGEGGDLVGADDEVEVVEAQERERDVGPEEDALPGDGRVPGSPLHSPANCTSKRGHT